MQYTLAIAQMMVAEQATDNVKKMEAMMREAQKHFRAGLILFSETCMAEFSRGMTWELRAEIAEALDGPFVSTMRGPAARFSVWIVFGSYEHTETADGEDYNYNSALILDDRGEIRGHYRKTHLYDALGYWESDDYLRGEQLFRPVDSPFGKLGLFVCYELRLPEIARTARAGGAETSLMPSTWAKGDLKSEYSRMPLKARAVENTCYLLATNRYSKVHMGESAAIDPMGIVTVNAGEEEAVSPIYLNNERLREMYERLSSFEDRREELHGSLSSNTMNRC